MRGKTRSWSLAGIRLVLMGKKRQFLPRTGGVLQPEARSLLRVANWPKWLKSRSSSWTHLCVIVPE